jgi:peptidoglycan/xylan/chitin deacetylase (PgdA/CDA1 family)
MNHLWVRMRQQLRWAQYQLQFTSGIGNPLQQRLGRRFLAYHGIDDTGRTDINSRFLKRSDLDFQLAWLKANCQLLPVDEYYDGQSAADRLSLALSFDDGYRNNFLQVLPLLEKHQVPAIFFSTASLSEGYPILWNDLMDLLHFLQPDSLLRWAMERELPTSIPGLRAAFRKQGNPLIKAFLDDCIPLAKFMQESKWDEYWQLMDPKELRIAAASPWVQIGSHSVLHADLAHMPDDVMEAECLAAKTWLESCIEQEVPDFAFPFGSYSEAQLPLLLGIGHRRIACMDLLPGAKPASVEQRFGNNPHVGNKVQLAELLRGTYY